MNFLKALFLFLFLLIGTTITAQKVDMDRKTISVNITRFPNSPKLLDYNTYVVHFSEPGGFFLLHNLNKDQIIDKNFNINGFHKAQIKGDFTLDVILNNASISQSTSSSTSTKDKNGKTHTSYFYILKYAVPVSYRLLDKSGSIIHSQVIKDGKNVKEWKSDNYDSPKDLENKMKNDFNLILNQQIAIYLNEAFIDLTKHVNENFGFGSHYVWVPTYELDSKKHPEYGAYKTSFDTIKLVLRALKPGCDIEGIRLLSANTIKYFEELVPKLSQEDKQQYKLLEATLTNLMYLHFYLDNYAKYNEYAGKLLSLIPEADKAKDRKEELDQIYKKMIDYKGNSLYYIRPINETPDEYVTASNIKIITVTKSDTAPPVTTITEEIFDYNQLKRNPTDIVYEGTVTDFNGKLVKGYFVLSTTNEVALLFDGPFQNINFVRRENGKNLKADISPGKFITLTFNGRVFKSITYKDPNDLLSKTSASALEVMVDNPKVQMYRYCNKLFNSNEIKTSWTFYKPDLKKPVTVQTKEMFWKKRAKEIFADCPAIMKEVEDASGLFGLSEAKFVDWSKRYETCAN